MKIKNKPKKPVRRTNIKNHLGDWYEDKIPVEDCTEDIRKTFEQCGYFSGTCDLSFNDYKSFYFQLEPGSYAEARDEVNIIGVRDESDKEFAERMVSYEKQLAKYQEWYQKNISKITEELQRRKDEQKKKAAHAAEIKKLEQKLKRLRGRSV